MMSEGIADRHSPAIWRVFRRPCNLHGRGCLVDTGARSTLVPRSAEPRCRGHSIGHIRAASSICRSAVSPAHDMTCSVAIRRLPCCSMRQLRRCKPRRPATSQMTRGSRRQPDAIRLALYQSSSIRCRDLMTPRNYLHRRNPWRRMHESSSSQQWCCDRKRRAFSRTSAARCTSGCRRRCRRTWPATRPPPCRPSAWRR